MVAAGEEQESEQDGMVSLHHHQEACAELRGQWVALYRAPPLGGLLQRELRTSGQWRAHRGLGPRAQEKG